METVELRPLSLGELLDRTFTLYRSHFWLFVGIMAIPAAFVVPAQILVGSLQSSFMNLTPGHVPTLPSVGYIVGVFLGYFALMLIFGIVYSIAVGAATCAVADSYLGRASTVRGSYARIRAKFWRLMGVIFNITLRVIGILLAVLAVGGGFIALIALSATSTRNPLVVASMFLVFILFYLIALVFCVWFALRYAISIPVLMIEDLGILDSIRRSVFLTRGRRGHIFLGLLVAGIIAYVGVFLFQGPFTIATMVAAVRGHFPLWLESCAAVSGAIGSAVTGPISLIVTVLLYYDTRIRKEAFDLQFMMSSLDRPAPAAGTVSPA
ncbi:MAG TPA: glycerophosphoryl diester phosphodiesterase membrane domain-containing protein [Candidatus Acidoferrales bacterium]|nr:glycerophosphoryl diester phosphodiesterase membrane domain-containing protein [Candidatus Acidoferrales bacterium]